LAIESKLREFRAPRLTRRQSEQRSCPIPARSPQPAANSRFAPIRSSAFLSSNGCSGKLEHRHRIFPNVGCRSTVAGSRQRVDFCVQKLVDGSERDFPSAGRLEVGCAFLHKAHLIDGFSSTRVRQRRWEECMDTGFDGQLALRLDCTRWPFARRLGWDANSSAQHIKA